MGTPLRYDSVRANTGPGVPFPRNTVSGLGRFDGQSGNNRTLPEIVTSSFTLTVLADHLTSYHWAVRMRRNGSWFRSPWARASDAAHSEATTRTSPAARLRATRPNMKFVIRELCVGVNITVPSLV